MDIAGALALIGQATAVVKSVRELEKGYDLAELKGQMADLYGKLADVKMALSDAREELHAKDEKIRELEATIEAARSGEACPICDAGKLRVVASRAHPTFGFAGVQQRTLECNLCNHTEAKLHDPDGRTRGR